MLELISRGSTQLCRRYVLRFGLLVDYPTYYPALTSIRIFLPVESRRLRHRYQTNRFGIMPKVFYCHHRYNSKRISVLRYERTDYLRGY